MSVVSVGGVDSKGKEEEEENTCREMEWKVNGVKGKGEKAGEVEEDEAFAKEGGRRRKC